MNHLLTSFRTFKASLVPETTLNRRKSIAFIRMFKRFNMRFMAILIFCAISQVLKAQTNQYPNSQADVMMSDKKAKKDTTKKCTYFVRLPVSDYQQLANALNEYKSLLMYDSVTADAQKVAIFKSIELYLKELPVRVKIDSTLKK